MLKHALLVLITIFFFSQPSYAHSSKVKLEQQLQHDAEVFLANEQFVSLSVGVVTGKNSYTKHFGELTIGKGNKPNDETLYEIGSVSKTMTGLLTAYALHDNKLALEENINRYIPDDLSKVSPESNPITIRQLLSHTSGLPRSTEDLGLASSASDEQAFLTQLNTYDTSDKKGRFLYSSVGTELLCYLLQEVYQIPFDSLLKDILHRMANITNTQVNLSEQQQSLLALGYDKNMELAAATSKASVLWGGSGFIKSSMSDLVKYMRLQLQQQNPIVIASQQTLFEVSQTDALAFYWIRSTDETLGTYFIHHGGLMGTQNWMMIFPQHELAISVITNSGSPSAASELREIGMNIAKVLINTAD